MKVMVVGVCCMSNPRRDLHNVKVDDIREPERQAERAAITAALARFQRAKVGVERPADAVAGRFKQCLAGTLAPSRDEYVQRGFRLAKASGAEGVYGLDADGDSLRATEDLCRDAGS